MQGIDHLYRIPEDHDDPGVGVELLYANAPNLPKSFLGQIITRYEGTSVGRSELLGEFIDEVEGALWSRALCDSCLLPAPPADLTRIVVGVDPAASSGEKADMTGIVVCGRDSERRYYVLADRTLRATPKGWASAAIKAYYQFQADRIVAEKNAGGEMVEAVLRQVDPSVSLKLVHASRGKRVRAEPVAAVFEQKRAFFCGDFPDLIDELCTWTVDDPQSPDRLDAMTWAMSELLDNRRSGFAIVGGPIIWGGHDTHRTRADAPAPATSSAWPPTRPGVRQPGLLMQPLSIATSCGFSVESPHPDGHHRTACLTDLVFNAHPSTLRSGRNP